MIASLGLSFASYSQVDKVREYIRNQEAHHAKTSFNTEFLSLLRRHHIEFDPKYVFDEEIIA